MVIVFTVYHPTIALYICMCSMWLSTLIGHSKTFADRRRRKPFEGTNDMTKRERTKPIRREITMHVARFYSVCAHSLSCTRMYLLQWMAVFAPSQPYSCSSDITVIIIITSQPEAVVADAPCMQASSNNVWSSLLPPSKFQAHHWWLMIDDLLHTL